MCQIRLKNRSDDMNNPLFEVRNMSIINKIKNRQNHMAYERFVNRSLAS